MAIEVLSEGYYEEHRSRFYALIARINSKEDLLQLIKLARSKEKDIKHVLSAATYRDLSGTTIAHASDDKEPISIAKKIMAVLEKQKTPDLAVAISRHYGGTNLGRNKLGKAYYIAFENALKKID